MRFGDCSVCGLPADVPCPECGSTATVPILYGYPGGDAFSAQEAGELVLGGCIIEDPSPDRQCRSCGTRFFLGWPDGPRFRRSFWDGNVQVGGSTQPLSPLADDLGGLLSEALRKLTDRSTSEGVRITGAVAGMDELDTILPVGVGGRAWWNGLRGLVATCSDTCLRKALDEPGHVRMSAWTLTESGEWHSKASGSQIEGSTALAHLSSVRDPVGIFVVHAGTKVFIAPETGVVDQRLTSWPDAAGPVEDELDQGSEEPESDSGAHLEPWVDLFTYECKIWVRVNGETLPVGSLAFVSTDQSNPHASYTADLLGRTAEMALNGSTDAFAAELAEYLLFGARAFLIRHNAHLLDIEDQRRVLTSDAVNVLPSVVDALSQRPEQQEQSELVYGNGPHGFIFMRRDEAQTLADSWKAVEKGGTLQEVLHRLLEAGDSAISEWLNDQLAQGELGEEEAKDMSWLASFCSDAEIWPWPAEADTQWEVFADMPETVQSIAEEHLQTYSTALDGSFFNFEDPEPVVEAIRAAGFSCARDDDLVTAANGPYQ